MSKIAIIDWDSGIYYSVFNKKIILEDGTESIQNKSLEDCIKVSEELIQTILEKTNCTDYILCLTVGKCFRYTVNPEYKANRKYTDPPEHLRALKDYYKTHSKAYFNESIEADDQVAILKKFLADKGVICSPDQDVLGLPGGNYNYKKHEWVVTTKKDSSLAFWKDMICGQSGDNIKGLVGKGESFYNKQVLEELNRQFDINSNYPFTEDEEANFIHNTLRENVLQQYINQYGEYEGLNQFHKMYMSLKIVSKYEGVDPELILKERGIIYE